MKRNEQLVYHTVGGGVIESHSSERELHTEHKTELVRKALAERRKRREKKLAVNIHEQEIFCID